MKTPGGYNQKFPSRPPAPPPGHGPVLAYYRQKRFISWSGGLIPPALAMTAFVLYDGVSAFAKWPLWVIAAFLYGWTVYVHRVYAVAAGSDWVSIRKYWVDTYELTQIQLRGNSANVPRLFLADSGDRSVEMPLTAIEGDSTVWSYVYLGMRHSAARGAKLDHNARAAYPELVEASRGASSENP